MAAPKIYNIHEAKSSLSRILKEVEEGREVLIARSGKPIARLTSFNPKQKPRVLGAWKGQVQIIDDLETPENLIDAFEGK